MAERRVSVRELRNDTPAVVRLIESGVDVTLTNNGVPIAVIHPIDAALRTAGAIFLAKIAELRGEPFDSGLSEDLASSKAESVAAQAERWG